MCGIFGWSFSSRARIPQGKREAMAQVLAVANSLRGDQSWGVYAVNPEGRSRIRKEVGDIAAVNGIGALGALPVVMAHTRYATTGAVTRENQHPFRVGKILLAHNGVIFNHDELTKKHGRACVVDSMHFAHHLDAGLPFEDIEGYGAIEWIEDPESRTVNLARLAGGSLTVFGIRNEKHKTVGVVWSSDRAHLESAIGAARLDAFPYEVLKEGQRYQAVEGRYLILEKAPLLKITHWQTARSSYYTSGGSYGWHGMEWDDAAQRWTPEPEDDEDREHTPVDVGLVADSKGRIHDTALDEERRLWDGYECDEEREHSRGVSGTLGMTEAEWLASEGARSQAARKWEKERDARLAEWSAKMKREARNKRIDRFTRAIIKAGAPK